MSREEKVSLVFVGSELIIIILLLLVNGGGQTVNNTDITLGGPTTAKYPWTIDQSTNLPNVYPLYIDNGPMTTVQNNLVNGDPCDCACSGETLIKFPDLSDLVKSLNDQARFGIIGQVQQFYSQLPGDLYFLTNANRLSIFEGG